MNAFLASLRSRRRPPLRHSEYVHMRHTGRDPYKPRVDKAGTIDLLARVGVLGPQTYGVFDRIENVPFESLPELMVIKPSELNGCRGVMLLHRIAGGLGYWDSMQRRRLTVPRIIDDQTAWATMYLEKRGRTLQFLAEELVVGENGPGRIPFDYKVYVYAGQPRLVVQVDRNVKPMGIAFFDGDFCPMAEGDPRVVRGKSQAIVPVVPACADALLATAVALSSALNTPFLRVDCFASPRGPVVGELTVSPGGSTFTFSDAYDQELGRAWTEALVRVGQPIPTYNEAWTEEPRRTSGLPLKL